MGGILAGSYAGNDYEGIATAAEIVATTSELYDASILAGVENVVEYARQESKPVVVNLSVGSYTGPHDGTDLFCQYLDRVGEEAVICISAGNEGMKQNTLSKRFNADDKSLNTFICNRSWDLIHIAGMSDFWGEDSLSFRAKMCIYDCVEKKIIYESPYVGGDSGVEEWGIASVEIAGDEDETNELMDSCFSGYMRLYAGLNAENNRYNIISTTGSLPLLVENAYKDSEIELLNSIDEFVAVDLLLDKINNNENNIEWNRILRYEHQ